MHRFRLRVGYVVFALIPILLISSGVQLLHMQTELKRAKAESAAYKDEALKNQVSYEGARNDVAHIQRDLEEAKKELAAERQRTAQARASRSRSLRTSLDVGSGQGNDLGGSSKQLSSTSAFRGGLHDITMYCPTGNTTASGKWPQRGMVATISRSIPFGTRIRIEGLGEFVVEDRIGHGSEFDIFTPSCSEADRFGRQHRRVTILDTN